MYDLSREEIIEARAYRLEPAAHGVQAATYSLGCTDYAFPK